MTYRRAIAVLGAAHRRAAAVLAAGVVAVVLSACGAPHPGLSNGAVTGCFKALPVARSALHGSKARLVGVHRLAADEVRRRLSQLNRRIPAELDTTVCAVAFEGEFPPGRVTGARTGATGRYAVVLVNAKQLGVVASYVGDRLPRNLQGRTV